MVAVKRIDPTLYSHCDTKDVYKTIPDGMKIKKLPQKLVRFNMAIFHDLPVLRDADDVDNIDHILGPNIYTSTTMSVKTSRNGTDRYITYDLTREDGYQFRLYRSVSLTGKDDSEFRSYLKVNGIKGSYWHDYVGCQETVMLLTTPWGELMEAYRAFVYEPKGGYQKC